MIMMRKGVERTMTTEMAKLKKTGTTTTTIMVKRKGMTTKREVGKWWEELLTNLRRRMMTTKLVFALHAPFDASGRSQQERYLGEGYCTFNHEEIPEHEMQPQQ